MLLDKNNLGTGLALPVKPNPPNRPVLDKGCNQYYSEMLFNSARDLVDIGTAGSGAPNEGITEQEEAERDRIQEALEYYFGVPKSRRIEDHVLIVKGMGVESPPS